MAIGQSRSPRTLPGGRPVPTRASTRPRASQPPSSRHGACCAGRGAGSALRCGVLLQCRLDRGRTCRGTITRTAPSRTSRRAPADAAGSWPGPVISGSSTPIRSPTCPRWDLPSFKDQATTISPVSLTAEVTTGCLPPASVWSKQSYPDRPIRGLCSFAVALAGLASCLFIHASSLGSDCASERTAGTAGGRAAHGRQHDQAHVPGGQRAGRSLRRSGMRRCVRRGASAVHGVTGRRAVDACCA